MAEAEPAKALLPYLQRADELQKHDPLIAYYCRFYAVEKGLRIPKEQRTATTNDLLKSILVQLEKDKKAVKLNDQDDPMYVEGFALNVFNKADKQDRAGKADINTAKTFYAASIFFETLRQFGELQPDIAEKQKYAVWKAADIRAALRDGRKPVPGPPGGEPELPPIQGGGATGGPGPGLTHTPSFGFPPAPQPSRPADAQLGHTSSFGGFAQPPPERPPSSSSAPLDELGFPIAPTKPPTAPPVQPPAPSFGPGPATLGHTSYPGPSEQPPPHDLPSYGPPGAFYSASRQPPPSAYTPAFPPPAPAHQPASAPPSSGYPSIGGQPSTSYGPPRQSSGGPPAMDGSFPLGSASSSAPPAGYDASSRRDSSPIPPQPPASAPPFAPATSQPSAYGGSYGGPSSGGYGGGPAGNVVPQAQLPPPVPGYQPDANAVAEAHKYSRFSVSALAFDDVPTAVRYLQQALALLTVPNAQIDRR